ncbi:MAG: FliH/SctL family protein [Actinomycetota bacterium]|nr:FliH/SctL family protein [Actinomycetota bacterium]
MSKASRIIRSDGDFRPPKLDKFVVDKEPDPIKAPTQPSRPRPENLPDKAARQAELLREEAFKQGYEGGLAQAEAETKGLIDTLEMITKRALEEKKKIVEEAEASSIKLAIDIAEKIINEEIRATPDFIKNVAKKALQLAVEREHVVLRLNPKDFEIIKESREELASSVDGIKELEIIADQRIRQGGCIIETAQGSVDARIDSQLGEISKKLLEGTKSGE